MKTILSWGKSVRKFWNPFKIVTHLWAYREMSLWITLRLEPITSASATLSISDRWIEAGGIGRDGTPKFVVEKYLQFMYEGDARMEAPVLKNVSKLPLCCEGEMNVLKQCHCLHDVAIFKIIPALVPDGMLPVSGARVEFTPERC